MVEARTHHDFYLEVAKALGITEHVNRITGVSMTFVASATPWDDVAVMEVHFLIEDDQQTALKEVIKKYKWIEDEEVSSENDA